MKFECPFSVRGMNVNPASGKRYVKNVITLFLKKM